MPDTNTYTALSSTRKVVSKAEFDAMDKTGIPVGTEYDIVAPIEKADLSTELQTEIDGKIDKPATDGTSGQVLTMGTDGKAKWADIAPSGGGKLYRHNMYFHAGPPEGYRITVYTSNATPYTPETFFADLNNNNLYCCGTVETGGKIYPIYTTIISETLKRIVYINSDGGQTSKDINVSQLNGSDAVYEV